jgi:hypothetical protein
MNIFKNKVCSLLSFCVSAAFSTKTSYVKDIPDYLEKLTYYYIYNNSCTDIKNRLALLEGIEYYDFDGQLKNDGSIVILDTLSKNVQKIFSELKAIKFPIGGISPFAGVHIKKTLWFKKFIINDDYDYTGSFHCRNIIGGKKRSLHSLGAAIDINPMHNPCIMIDMDKKIVTKIIPKDGILYLNRGQKRMNKPYRPGIIDQRVKDIFKKNGFNIWGGDWDFPVDYHHFQLPRNVAESLVKTNRKNAKILFAQHIKSLK